MSKYEKVDQKIVENVAAGLVTFGQIQTYDLRTLCDEAKPGGEFFRVVDARLQALKGKGILAFDSKKGWYLVAKGPGSMSSEALHPVSSQKIGSPFEGGFYAGCINIHGDVHAVVCSGAAGELMGSWHQDSAQAIGASSVVDSMANTRAMAEAGSVTARSVMAMSINGKTDWCIPASAVLEMLYRAFKTSKQSNHISPVCENLHSVPPCAGYTLDAPGVTTAKGFTKTGREKLAGWWYWSSTQQSATEAYGKHFDDGQPDRFKKSVISYCRAVRLVKV